MAWTATDQTRVAPRPSVPQLLQGTAVAVQPTASLFLHGAAVSRLGCPDIQFASRLTSRIAGIANLGTRLADPLTRDLWVERAYNTAVIFQWNLFTMDNSGQPRRNSDVHLGDEL